MGGGGGGQVVQVTSTETWRINMQMRNVFFHLFKCSFGGLRTTLDGHYTAVDTGFQERGGAVRITVNYLNALHSRECTRHFFPLYEVWVGGGGGS